MGILYLIITAVVLIICIPLAVSGSHVTLNLRNAVDKMWHARQASYPEGELPIQLNKHSKTDGAQRWQALIPWQTTEQTSNHAERFRLDFEEEKHYPYYMRTFNVISDVSRYSDQQLETGSWYGCDEWLQDMTANKVKDKILQGNMDSL